jgi:2-methylcitrate dehydratase PrpD
VNDARRTGVTRELARFIVESRWSSIPTEIRHEAKRALLNWAGCAIGGCRDKAVDTALAALSEFAGRPQATVLRRSERMDILNAAVLNALSANILDFDDTHLRTVLYPTVPVAAAAACAKLLDLDAKSTAWAFGIAASQGAGTTGAHGSMTKSWNMANAARNGLMAALLAARGFTSTEQGLEGERGFTRVFAQRRDLDEIIRGLGKTWELMQNAYKRYPCGIVAHPVIDACLALRDDARAAPDAVERIELRVHPLVRMLMGNAAPLTGLEAKLSVQHCAAAALIYGQVGVHEFTEACVNDRAVVALRARAMLVEDSAMSKEAAGVTIHVSGGSTFDKYVLRATGSLDRPMSDEALGRKFHSLAEWRWPECDTRAFIELPWTRARSRARRRHVRTREKRCRTQIRMEFGCTTKRLARERPSSLCTSPRRICEAGSRRVAISAGATGALHSTRADIRLRTCRKRRLRTPSGSRPTISRT